METKTDSLVISARTSATVDEIVDLMKKHNVGSVVIVSETTENFVKGIVTDRDLVLRVLDSKLDPSEVPVSDVMTKEVVTLNREADVMKIIETMVEHGIRRIPLVDEGELVDIVALDDLMTLISGQQVQLAEVIEAEMPDYVSGITQYDSDQ